ncbi:MAG: HAD family phosphatase [Phycisphaerae bacterium]|nr:HAD family phosphatase [Phycisphaerae bacterium]
MLKLVLFDFDGVIADSEPAHYEIFRQVCFEEGIDLSWAVYEQRYLGYTDQECFYHVYKDNNRVIRAEIIDDLCQRKKILFAEYIKGQEILLPGVREILIQLRDAGITCSICSGALKSEVEFILDNAGLREFFTCIVAAEDVEHGKPHPEGYELALKLTNKAINADPAITTEECIVIEDSLWGIQAGHAAGIKCLGLATTYQPNALAVAEHVVKNLSEASVSLLQSMV